METFAAMQTLISHSARRPSPHSASPQTVKASIVSGDRALVAAARRIFSCAGIVVSVHKTLDEFFASPDAAGRRPTFVVLDAREKNAIPDALQDRLTALEGRGNRVLVVGPTSPETQAAGLPFPTVLVHGDYAPVSALLQDWLPTRPDASSGEAAESRSRLLRINDAAHEVYVGEEHLPLRPTEYALLRFFLERPHHLFSRADLLRLLWGKQAGVELRTVDVHVMRLRKALRPYGLEKFIETVFGFGYRANHAVLDASPADRAPIPPPPNPRTRNAR